MDISWNPEKAEINLKKHGVHFSDTELVFSDDCALSFEDSDAIGEQRFVRIGQDSLGDILVVVYTERYDSIRVISARKATRKEVKQYYER